MEELKKNSRNYPRLMDTPENEEKIFNPFCQKITSEL